MFSSIAEHPIGRIDEVRQLRGIAGSDTAALAAAIGQAVIAELALVAPDTKLALEAGIRIANKIGRLALRSPMTLQHAKDQRLYRGHPQALSKHVDACATSPRGPRIRSRPLRIRRADPRKSCDRSAEG
jgi:hypothetical protein